MSAMRAIPGARDIKDDWENPSITIKVVIDQEAARRANVTSADVAEALNGQLTGVQISGFRVGDLTIPVMVRATGEARKNLDRLRILNGSTAICWAKMKT
jgi:multidrug efflux pump